MASVAGDQRRQHWQQARRQTITLDLFTRHGSVWRAIHEVREQWGVTATVAIPPAPPPGDLAVLGLLTIEQMPERIHIPPWRHDPELSELLCRNIISEHESLAAHLNDVHQRLQTAEWLQAIRDMYRRTVPEARRSGDDDYAWMSWAPFLSACVLYDPPDDALLDFAAHDDAWAVALPKQTYWQDADTVREADASLRRAVDLIIERVPPGRGRNMRVWQAWKMRCNALAESWQRSFSTPVDERGRGKPPTSDLEAVQCAILKDHYRLSHGKIAERFGWDLRPDSYDTRRRSNQSITRVKLGREILLGRKYSRQ